MAEYPQEWADLDPYERGYADGYADALGDTGAIGFKNRIGSPERDRMRNAARQAAVFTMLGVRLEDVEQAMGLSKPPTPIGPEDDPDWGKE